MHSEWMSLGLVTWATLVFAGNIADVIAGDCGG